jgi:uncharacterized protein YdhG (YjbR/CyaY superfamily)
MANRTTPKDIDEYIAGYPADVQKVLEKVRKAVRKAAPKAEEAIKYGIPTLTLNGNLISFAAYRKHIGVYPIPAGDQTYRADIAPYKAEKSTLRFPFDRPIPYGLIGRTVKFRIKEHTARLESEGKKKKERANA